MLGHRRISSFTKDNTNHHYGETLFQFMKRNKKITHNQSVPQQKNKSSSQKQDFDERRKNTPNIQTKRQKSYQPNNYSNCKLNFDNTSNTPRRVKFVENDEKKTNRSFIQMISPLKHKNIDRSISPQLYATIKPSILKNPRQNYSRRSINQKLFHMKQTLQVLIQTGKNAKEKAHILFIQIKPILRYVEDNADRDLLRKVQNTKEKLRTFEMLFKKFNVQDSSEIIQSFHLALSEHINSVEADLRCQFENKFIQSTQKHKNNHQSQCQKLQCQNSTLIKQIEILERRLEKVEKVKMQILENNETHEQQLFDQHKTKLEAYQNKISTLQAKINTLQKSIEQYSQREIDLQKKLKTAEYIKQENQRKFREEADSIKSKKQQFLLSEIMMLKTEFKKDMTQITDLYSAKQSDYLQTIKQLQLKIEEVAHQRKCDKQFQSKYFEELNVRQIQVQTIKYKKQNQCLITDMHRMNQELYQHWLALKDIKTLSTRLSIFPKFKRIYEDLSYNQFLFS